MQTEKPSCQDPAIEVGAQLALDEASDRRALLARVGKEALEIVSHDLVEQGLFGLVASILDGAESRRDRGLDESLLDIGAGSPNVPNRAVPSGRGLQRAETGP